MASPRVLTITFKLRVPPGLPANVRVKRIDTAVASFIAAVRSLAPSVFPWAKSIDVDYTWSYQWLRGNETVLLMPTAENTGDEQTAAAERAMIGVPDAEE
ncbi:hypothetical protein E1258_14445 [Micromonospora sp. KC207]|uniref:hypothetical protein n=1 Tax=Micromonospora sp. KC207 TaxID=2530377 RepID=UPI00104EE898|nr:hypothetical protein [Micromonospora sp. KC207]TDC60556.1 hypothetical protein E1258_14445 [Micromonospora sp. KC207]